MRYFIELSYNGTRYAGWQRQPNAMSVQQMIEEKLAVLLRHDCPVIGCGRTDAGVHASQFFLHFDHEGEIPEYFISRMNKLLPEDIALYRLIEVEPEAHTRFDATKRAYEYHLGFAKNPFRTETVYHYKQWEKLDLEKMQEAARLLMNYGAFYPFCKSNSDAKTMNCQLFRSEWEKKSDGFGLIFHVEANRFLRGMVRLIVGMCLNVGMGKMKVEAVKTALDNQERMKKSLSAPPHGLFLTRVEYAEV